MKRAIIYGSAMASFCVEKFGTERLTEVSKEDIDRRLEQFQEAIDLIARAMEDRVEEARFSKARLDVYRRWARSCPEAAKTEQPFSVFEEAGRLDGAIPPFSGLPD